MTLSKNKLGIDSKGINGLYVHCNPPRILSVSAAHIKQLIRNGDIEKLEQLVYEGQGKKLIGEYSADYKTRTFLKSVPALMSKIALLHDSLNSDRLSELQSILDEEPEKKKKLVMAKDRSGVGLLHKAVYYDLKSIYRWLIDKFPHLVNLKDSEGRTPYFYTLMCKEPLAAQKLLTLAGADPNVVDYRGHTTKYYSCHLQELELPHCSKSAAASRRTTASLDGLNYKKSNIRIWIHQRNMANLQQVIWDGHGSKLLVEHSNNAKMRKFLDAVPFIMGVIKDVHCDVHNGDLDSLKNRVTPPVPAAVLKSKDRNGLTPLHKAVGLGKDDIATYIIDKVPESVKAVDNEGRTPLHYAAILKDDQKMFNCLISRGADESALDNKQKTAAYYRTRASELDTKVLNTIPECPRGAKEPSSFDWCMLSSAEPALISNGFNNRKSRDKSDNGVPAKIVMPDKRVNSEEKPTSEPPQDEARHEDADEHIEMQENVNVNHNGHQEPEELDKSIEGQPEEPETVPDSHKVPEQSEEHPETINEQSDDDTVETTNNENIQNNKEAEAENIDDAQIEEGKSSPINGEAEEEEQDNDEGETEVKRQSSGKSQQSEEEKSEPSSNHLKQPSVDRVSPEKLLEDDTEGEGVIEGIVNGEDEVEPVNNEGPKRPATEDEDVKSLIGSGNMEQLASLVLSGHGDKLVGESSDNPELQAFLDNVPVYMSKINRIHQAAQEGILRDLQAALDRRKFAVARDKISPNGATPLHVAVVFGRTSIVRYLAGRFPETLHVEDDNGRTPLHYAAVIRDNGHYYNLLTHLGADNRIKDKFGRTPVYYTKIQTDFNHRKLLKDFGVEVNEDEDPINDKADDLYSACKNLDDEDMIAVLDKCYVVIQGRRNSLFSAVSVPNLSTVKNMNTNKRPPPTIVSKQMKRNIFEKIKLRITKLDHNLYDVIWPSVKKLPSEPSLRLALEADFPLGIVAPDFYVYKVFQEFFDPVIKEYNCMDLRRKFSPHPPTKFLQNGAETYIDLDQAGSLIMTGTLECTRNIKGYELPKSLTASKLESVEHLITDILMSRPMAKALYPNATEDELKENGSGSYYTMTEVLEQPSEARVILASNSLLLPLWNIPESDRLHGKHWPYGRGVFISNNNSLAIYVNVLDHIRIVTRTPQSNPGNIGLIYSRLSRIMNVLEQEIDFIFDEELGHLSSRPTTLGCGLNFVLTLKCANLLKEPDNLRSLCAVRGLTYSKPSLSTEVFKVGNRITLSVTEWQCFEDFARAVSNILQLEKDMSMSNSIHIAAMFLSIFKKRKTIYDN